MEMQVVLTRISYVSIKLAQLREVSGFIEPLAGLAASAGSSLIQIINPLGESSSGKNAILARTIAAANLNIHSFIAK